MLPRADLLGTRPAVAVEAPEPVEASTDARQEVLNRLSQIALGRQLQAEVIKRLNDGTFIVQVADTKARMMLPEGTKVGDRLSMTMLAKQPKPVFLLDEAPGSAAAHLSSAGRMIASLLQSAQQQNASTAIRGDRPLVIAPQDLLAPETTPKLANALKDILSSSGLFYESHLEDWISGGRTLSDIMREPQAKFPQASASRLPSGNASGTEISQFLNHMKAWDGSPQALMDLLQGAQRQLPGSGFTDAETIIGTLSQPAADIAPQSAQTVNQQLHVFEQRQIVWQGELWPDNPIEWEVSEDTPRQQRNDGEQLAWHSTVRFRLPLLGEVSASVHLRADRVQVDIDTASAETADLLLANGKELADAFEAAGMPLASFLVKRNEKA